MNLYKVMMTHAAQKGSNCAIKEYLIAKDEVTVFEYLKKSYTYWGDYESCPEEYEDAKEKLDFIWENKGDSSMESKWTDLYYGATMYDWELFKENLNSDDIATLERLEIAKLIK